MSRAEHFIAALPIMVIAFFSVIANAQDAPFIRVATERSGQSDPCSICNRNDPVSSRVLREYGAVFVSQKATPPLKCVFESEQDLAAYRSMIELMDADIGGTEITLQASAMSTLLAAVAEADRSRLRITPLDGKIAGTRSYTDTARLWDSRFLRALNYWQARGRISKADADAARTLPAYEQVPLVLKWEERGIWFSTGFNRSILTSVAAPGTSQHLSGLAFDLTEYRNARVRAILNKHGWFQTVAADEPHFTFLGAAETDLPGLGLKAVLRGGYKYWVPAL